MSAPPEFNPTYDPLQVVEYHDGWDDSPQKQPLRDLLDEAKANARLRMEIRLELRPGREHLPELDARHDRYALILRSHGIELEEYAQEISNLTVPRVCEALDRDRALARAARMPPVTRRPPRTARRRGAGRPRAQAARSGARSGDSGDDEPGPSATGGRPLHRLFSPVLAAVRRGVGRS